MMIFCHSRNRLAFVFLIKKKKSKKEKIKKLSSFQKNVKKKCQFTFSNKIFEENIEKYAQKYGKSSEILLNSQAWPSKTQSDASTPFREGPEVARTLVVYGRRQAVSNSGIALN